MKNMIRLIIGVLLALCVFHTRDAQAYCYRYSKYNSFADSGNWNKWGSQVQPGSGIYSNHWNGHMIIDWQENQNVFEVLERTFTLAEVNDSATSPGCAPAPLPPSDIFNPIKACQGTAYVLQASGKEGAKFTIMLIDPSNYAIISERDYFYKNDTANYVITTPLATYGCKKNMILRFVLNNTGYYGDGLILRDSQVNYYTN